MRNILDSINKKNHVKLGRYTFSPLMELSAGIVLSYCDDLVTDKCKKVPLVLCFPEKKGAALWTSLLLLTNSFLEDYIDSVVDGIDYKKGDKVKIYGSICEVGYISDDRIELKFKNHTFTILKDERDNLKRLINGMSRVPKNRALNKHTKFLEGKRQIKINRNPISKILIPNDAEIINQANLDSKVLLIAGRGNIKAFHELLNDSVFYEEKLSKTFGLGKNLIIKPDLKTYVHLFSKEVKLKLDSFAKSLIKFSEIVCNNAYVKETVSVFMDRLDSEEGISEDFEIDFLSFIEEYEGEFEEQLKFIMNKFPGVKEALPTKLKAVVLNDISQIEEYSETINGFLARRIPVVVVSNRNVSTVNDIEFYSRLFSNNPDYYRINWNRKKILGLIECTAESSFIDRELWEQSKRYASQLIKINVIEGCELDVIIGQLLKEVKELDEFEILQKAFYKYFYPALYALKNSNNKTEEVTHLISEFKIVFDGIKGNGLPSSVIAIIQKGIDIAYNFESNTKIYNPANKIFSNNLSPLDSVDFYIPSDVRKKNLPTSNKSKLIFTGYPYQEYSGKFLLNSACVDFIPDIEILCWPNEGSLTKNYLTRRLKAGYFTDYLDEKLNFPPKFLLNKKSEFIIEIDSFLTTNSDIPEDIDHESNLSYLHTFKYKGYSSSGEHAFKVRCNTLNFKDGSFLFLPKKSSILAEIEYEKDNIKIANLKFSDLSCGLRVFKYQKDRSLFKQIAKKNNELKKAYENLEFWRLKLAELFAHCNHIVNDLFRLLCEAQVKYDLQDAKPTKTNLRNWLFDEDMIMPDRANVKLILCAASCSEDKVENQIDKLHESYLMIKAHRRHLSSVIKKTITQQFVNSSIIQEARINIEIEEINISVDVKTIERLDQSDLEIEYHHTRKILC